RSLGEFETYIDSLSHGGNPPVDYFHDEWTAAPSLVPEFELLQLSNGAYARRLEFDSGQTVTYKDNPAGASGIYSPTGCHAETANGVIIWNADPSSTILLAYGGTDSNIGSRCATQSPLLDDEISYEDVCNEMSSLSNCGGVLALGGFGASSSPTSVACQA